MVLGGCPSGACIATVLLRQAERDHIIYDVKLVLDTDVVTAAVRSPTGASAELLRLAALGRCRLIVSVPLMLEYEAVLMRNDHLAASRLDAADMGYLLDGIA